MKILAIRGKNLASLEGEFCIDFTQEPLKSAGIFAITGNTGSGKSTLLDALCLALFNDTPRTSRATENAEIADSEGTTINQKDSRTILRKGTCDGYAEVDYQSLSGETYRSRWSVKRAYNKINGRMGNAEIRINNLSNNSDVQGTKTELLKKNVELIGLTFEQFTRAVLLAQGDFATFLKAKEAEKAELLEKLTGTDIYSQISISIYNKTKDSKNKLKETLSKIENVELLTTEQIEALSQEKEELKKKIELLKKDLSALSAKAKWITDNELIEKEVQQAQSQFSRSELDIEYAAPRFELIKQIEEVQEIRDSFNLYKSTQKQLAENVKTQEKLSADLNTLDINEKGYVKAINEAEEESKQLAQKEEISKPIILKARELDIKLETGRKNLLESQKEYEKTRIVKATLEKEVEEKKKEAQKAGTEKVQLDKWFKSNDIYKDLIPNISLLIRDLNALTDNEKQETANTNLLFNLERQLLAEEQKLDALNKESERLNNLLPAEIAALRAKLREGEACPVCGSIHHNIQSTTEETQFQEKEINEAKQKNAKEIEEITTLITKRKEEFIRIKSMIENYAQQINNLTNSLAPQLSSFPKWREQALKNQLQGTLKQLAIDWNENQTRKNNNEQKIAALEAEILAQSNNLKVDEKELESRKVHYEQSSNDFNAIKEERSSILNGRSADEIENLLKQKKEVNERKLADLKKMQGNIATEKARLSGIVEQIKTTDLSLKSTHERSKEEIKHWLDEKGKDLSEDQLLALLSKDPSWIKTEKEHLNQIKEAKTRNAATLAERKKKQAEHQENEFKPQDGEDKDSIDTLLKENNIQTEQQTKRISEIEIRFENHQKGKSKVKALQKELDAQKELSENWEKLNELFGSAEGVKFKKIAQGYTLDALLGYANRHLKELTNRYELQRIPDTLALQVIDLDMFDEVRTVHSLSGGESFLVSLALALALSSLSSNRMNIESLFIDEGFGSLDIDTLRIALDALEQLQSQGRRIGVISHVAEMTERITTQIRVEKDINGRSKIKIVG